MIKENKTLETTLVEFNKVESIVSTTLDKFKDYKIEKVTSENYNKIFEDRTVLNRAIKDVSDIRKEYTKPLQDVVKQLQTREKEIVKELVAIQEQVSENIKAFNTADTREKNAMKYEIRKAQLESENISVNEIADFTYMTDAQFNSSVNAIKSINEANAADVELQKALARHNFNSKTEVYRDGKILSVRVDNIWE